MATEPCNERHNLSRTLSLAVAALYKARGEYDAARESKAAGNVFELQIALTARNAELSAVRSLRETARRRSR
jgi:hypothetical protein